MKKFRIFTLLVISIFLLTACSAPEEQATSSADAWFDPTPPEEIQLASGQIQFFKFSAVW